MWGREWTRKSIEELVDDTVKQMIDSGEIDPGGDPVDYRNPYNAPFMIDVSYNGGGYLYQVQSIGIIRTGCFNNENTALNAYDTYLSYPLGPDLYHLNQYPTDPPVVSNSYGHPVGSVNLDYNVKSSYALSSRASFCCKLQLAKVLPTGSGSTYSNFLIIQNAQGDKDLLSYVEKNGYILFPDSSNYNNGRKNIASVFLDKHSYGDLLGNNGAVKAKTFIYVDNTNDLFGQTSVSIIDNPPPLFFVANEPMPNDVVTHTYNNLAFDFGRSQVCVCVAFLVADTTEMQSVIDWFQNANHNACVYAYCLEMTDEQVQKWVNPNDPSTVTVNHITI